VPTLRPFWHPLSTLLLVEPPCFATRTLLELLVRGGPIELRYAGDRMWPAVRHGATLFGRPLPDGPLALGSAVIACPDGIPDLWRVDDVAGETYRLSYDADPLRRSCTRDTLLAVASSSERRTSRSAAVLRRLSLDLREAWYGAPDPVPDPAATVRDKYDAQAPFYAAAQVVGLDPTLGERVCQRVVAGGRLLVVGSGVGTECFDLAGRGFRVTGVDFAPAMIAESQKRARELGLEVDFRLDDVRAAAFEPARVDGVLFTYDVYSFIPSRAARVRLLGRLAGRLERSGCIFLSARLARTGYERAVLTLQRTRRRASEWGDSHTRWIDPAGRLRRSFVHLFTASALRDELRAAGLRLVEWQGGHGTVVPAASRSLL
jgi:2-polyprenyl-3-methyl-5-hydroxy-6-metoxy-1,4-benzoquinol methylase